jgi:hypothetical protein
MENRLHPDSEAHLTPTRSFQSIPKADPFDPLTVLFVLVEQGLEAMKAYVSN